MMISIRPVLGLLPAALLLSVAAAPTSAQGSLVTGRPDPNATRGQAQYMAYMSASVDTVVRAWQRAMKARDADSLAALYTDDAILALSTGRLVKGRGSVRDAYERILPRMHAARMEVVQIIASADVASVVATLDCEIKLPSGGWYHRELTVLLTIKAQDRGRFRIAIQSGGDVQMLSAAAPRTGAPGAKNDDSLAVVLTDASGLGVPGVLVSFLVEHGAGAIEPAVAVTDANGRAAAQLNASPSAEPSIVRAAAATLLEEPVFFTATGGAGTDSTNARSATPRQ
jgi:uncharacterized protein (TIGR02246 family)